MALDEREYHAYLLRLWPTKETSDNDDCPRTVWRVTLDDIQTHTRCGFADLEQAFAFLQQRIHRDMEDFGETDHSCSSC